MGGGHAPGVITLLVGSGSVIGQRQPVSEAEAHHLRVRRASAGDEVGLRDGAGLVGTGRLASVGREWVVEVARVEHRPRLVCHDFIVLKAVVLNGLGIALLPEGVVRAELANGMLERVLPSWNLPLGICHIVFPTRRGLLPAVRAFIDFLAERLPPLL